MLFAGHCSSTSLLSADINEVEEQRIQFTVNIKNLNVVSNTQIISRVGESIIIFLYKKRYFSRAFKRGTNGTLDPK